MFGASVPWGLGLVWNSGERSEGRFLTIRSGAPDASVPEVSRSLYYRLAVVLGALTAMGPLAIDMYLPALPTIARDLETSAASVQVSLAVYFAGIALGQAFYGPLSDRWGRKPALYFGLTLFVLSSVGCALADNVRTLIVLRLLQALGGCAPLV